jgi:NAD(P)-dependent dehydrogenase (short-subunit alcohol dehydrogenase family)
MSQELSGNVAIITGGSRGIGAACAHGLAARGAHVVISYSRSEHQAREVVEAIVHAGGIADAIRADQADPQAAVNLINNVARTLGRLDVLVNNAAVAAVGRIDGSFDQGELDHQLTVNYTSIVAAIRAAAALMTRGGRIVNIGSGVAARAAIPGVADHAGTKAALAAFTRGAARDLAHRGITVNLVQSGLVDTELARSTGGNPELLLGAVPLGRFGAPEEVAAGVTFLASPQASYITGATLDIDGGFGA